MALTIEDIGKLFRDHGHMAYDGHGVSQAEHALQAKRSLKLQGGVFTQAQVQEFLARPHSDDALKVRRWDDAAKAAGARTRPLSHYLDIAKALHARLGCPR